MQRWRLRKPFQPFQWQAVTGTLVAAVARLGLQDYQSGRPQAAGSLDAYYIRRPDAELLTSETDRNSNSKLETRKPKPSFACHSERSEESRQFRKSPTVGMLRFAPNDTHKDGRRESGPALRVRFRFSNFESHFRNCSCAFVTPARTIRKPSLESRAGLDKPPNGLRLTTHLGP